MRGLRIGGACWEHRASECMSDGTVPSLLGVVVGIERGGINVRCASSDGEGWLIRRIPFSRRVFATRGEALAAGACVGKGAPLPLRAVWLRAL